MSYISGWFSDSYLDTYFDPSGSGSSPPGTGGDRPPRVPVRAALGEAQPNAAAVLSLSQGITHHETHRAVRALENLVRDLLTRVNTLDKTP